MNDGGHFFEVACRVSDIGPSFSGRVLLIGRLAKRVTIVGKCDPGPLVLCPIPGASCVSWSQPRNATVLTFAPGSSFIDDCI